MKKGVVVVTLALIALAPACSYTTQDITPRIPANAESSKVFAADGSVITVLHAEQNREEVPLIRIPAALRNAVIAIEDERFYQHTGVDLRAVVRAARANAQEGEITEGGSTITQQLVKNTLLGTEKTLKRKVQEAALAWQLENRYTKDRILELYLNTIYFGNGAYGVQAAANEYFNKPVEQLNVAEAALLAGLIQSPGADDPFDDPVAAVTRRGVVLDKMRELGMLTDDELAAAEATPLQLAAPVDVSERYQAAHFVEEVKRFLLDDQRFGDTPADRRALLFTGGLRIYTTVDLGLQAAAEAAVAQVLDQPDRDPQAALVSLDPATGYVRAMVGGRDFFGADPQAKFNLAMGKGRPTGSSFKPLVLASALEHDIPLTEQLAAPPTIDLTYGPDNRIWHVENYEESGPGVPVDLVEATVKSYNKVYAQLILQVGAEAALDTAKRLGIRTPLHSVPAAVLGTNDVRPLDMASAYGTLANRGVNVPPVFVTKVTRADGTVLFEHVHRQEKVLDPGIADTVTGVLEQVIQRGTGTAADITRPAAGKTGTTQAWRDAWFCGYTRALSTAVWVGFAERQIGMEPPRTRIRVTGGSWPAQIWQKFMAAALEGVSPRTFNPPPPSTPELDVETTPTTLPAGTGVRVPFVVGLPYGEASEELRRLGLVPSRIDVPDDRYPPGTVRAQSPVVDTAVAPRSTVTLEVSTGAADSVSVPAVIGMRVSEAVAAMNARGLHTEVTFDPEGPGATAVQRRGRVWSQSPGAESEVRRGSMVQLWANPE